MDAPATPADTDGGATDTDAPTPPRTALTVAGVTAAVALPIVVGVLAVRSPRWYPLVDMSQIEMRVRDVGTAHPPLVGLGGRIVGLDTQGSHPGPLGFYLLAPVYRLLGSSAWALQVSAASLNVAVVATAVWVAHRRQGLRGALVAGAGLTLLLRMYGTLPLVHPWNPYMPVLFWALFLVCVWAVLCGDVALLPIAVVAGSVCAQTHLPYVGLVGGSAVVVLVALAMAWRRAGDDPAARRRLGTWIAGSLALGVVLWAPVLVEEVGGDPGNLSVIVDSFRHPRDPELGLRAAWDLLLEHVDAAELVGLDPTVPGSRTIGLVTLLAWAATAGVAWRDRRRRPALARLHVAVAAVLVLGLVSMSRILGVPWPYLTLWAHAIAVLALVATVATAVAVAGDRVDLPAHRAPAWAGWAPTAALLLAIVVPSAILTRSAPDTVNPDAPVWQQIGRVIAPTIEAIEDGELGDPSGGTILVTWSDEPHLGSTGLAMLLELERRGHDVGAAQAVESNVRSHRVVDPADAAVAIHVAVGDVAIEAARDRPGAREIALDDPRSAEQIADAAQLRARAAAELEDADLDGMVSMLDENPLRLALDPRTPDEVLDALDEIAGMPQPIGVVAWDPAT